jgi:short-subunit dehydrogenase
MRVFITGASSGIGRALALEYSRLGATLGLVARRTIELTTLSRSQSQQHRTYSLDVRDANAVRDAAADFISTGGAPDIVIANAGISTGTTLSHAEDLHVLQDVIDVNVIGLANTLQPFVDVMRAAGAGSLVGIASVAAYRGLPGAGAYSASKAAAVALLESLRVELQGSGVSVTTICPGYIETPMTAANPYRMPFILRADDAARRIIRAIGKQKRHAVIPWQMALVAKALRVLPDPLYDAIFSRAPRKPRSGSR